MLGPLDIRIRGTTELTTSDNMAEIVMYTSFGSKVLEPFSMNKAEDISAEKEIINPPSEDATNQESEVASDINADD